MAEITANPRNTRRRAAPRIDFTPMVDLGFILITFFIYTTTIATPSTLELKLPSTEPTTEPTAFIEESTITLLPIGAHQVAYYCGILPAGGRPQIIPITAVRQVLRAKQKALLTLPATYSKEAHQLHILLKPTPACTYQDVVTLLDETSISGTPYTALVDPTIEETKVLKIK